MIWDFITAAFLISIPWLIWNTWIGYIFIRIPFALFQGAWEAVHRR